jgi:hypothetical protein
MTIPAPRHAQPGRHAGDPAHEGQHTRCLACARWTLRQAPEMAAVRMLLYRGRHARPEF